MKKWGDTMKSLRTKITFVTICVITLAIIVVSSLSVFFIRNTEHKKSDQFLLLLADTGKENLDYYFDSVQRSVEKVSKYANSVLKINNDEALETSMEDIREFFETTAYKTNGVFTYYFRIDPEVSSNVKGFWYTNLDDTGFKEQKVTDITKYDTSDTSKLVWFTVPKNEKKPIWISPYFTDGLNLKVISYNYPITYGGRFIGVIGIEIDYTIMANQVNGITLFDDGYAFLSDDRGNLFYHPKIDLSNTSESIEAPKGVNSSTTYYTYEYQGVKKEAVWKPLRNGMRINVSVPVSEMEGDWQKLILNIVIVSFEVLIISTLFLLLYTRKISKPLKRLAEAAEQVDNGNYDYELKYEKDDELGKLTKTFKDLSAHVKDNITNLNKQVFVDSLTQVKNKAAYIEYMNKIEDRIIKGEHFDFSIGIFDCNDLKKINDLYGHDKGDTYLKITASVLLQVFQHGYVYRIGGDEFAVILENDDFYNKDNLFTKLENTISRNNSEHEDIWDRVNVAYGFAEYDPLIDRNADEVMRRADKLMYDDKLIKKNKK